MNVDQTVKSVRANILSEMAEPEVYDGMSDIEMLADLEAETYACHYDADMVRWRDDMRKALGK